MTLPVGGAKQESKTGEVEDSEGEEDVEQDAEEEEGDEGFDEEKLRAYEIQKLRYYFAIAECDTVATASTLYEQVDGIEFENSSAQIDVRFVPDDADFEGREVRDQAKAMRSNYGESRDEYTPPVLSISLAASWAWF